MGGKTLLSKWKKFMNSHFNFSYKTYDIITYNKPDNTLSFNIKFIDIYRLYKTIHILPWY